MSDAPECYIGGPLSVEDVKLFHTGHWFDADTMRYFRSRILYARQRSFPDGACGFVTSEKGPDGVRRYTVRVGHWRQNHHGLWSTHVDTLGAFQGFATAAAAERWMMLPSTSCLWMDAAARMRNARRAA